MRKTIYVLDSYAILAYFQAEPGGLKVKELLKKAKAEDAVASMSLINLGEVIYNTGRKLGEDRAKEILDDIMLLPIQLVEVTRDRVLAAARIKTQYPISYADAFAVSLAQELNATIVTGDPEFKQVESLVTLFWL